MNSSETHPYLHARIQIGNSKGPIQYNQQQTVFHHDDVPHHKRIRKQEVQEFARRKILEEDTSWKLSNKVDKPVVERRTMENHAHDRSHRYQFNHRAETLTTLRNLPPVDKSTKFHISMQLESTAREIMKMKEENMHDRGQFCRTQEMPVHPKLDEAVAWNNTTVLTLKEQHQGLDKKTNHAREWTGKVNSTLSARKEYLTPMQRTKAFGEKVRQKKFEGTFSAKVLLDEPPRPPEEIFEIGNRFQNDKMKSVKLHSHSGTWGPNAIDGTSMWSDTGSCVFSSKGDMITGVHLDRSNRVDAVKGSRREEPSTMRQPPTHYSTRPSTRTSSREFDTGNNAVTLSKLRTGTA